ncbi:helix-turn-helix domain-containing protein [Paenibacillus paeoniae]|nr:helix-turn-helix domain-containing protein [Paenibacillus paeoniae]
MENKDALTEVEERLRSTKDRRMYGQLQTVRLRLRIMGTPVKETAGILCRSEKTIRSYIRTYETERLTALHMRFSPQRSTRLTPEQREKLKQVIVNQVPAEVGFTAKFNWTLQLIADYIERTYGHRYSLRGVSKVMKRMNLSFDETFPALKRVETGEIAPLLLKMKV